MKLRKPWMIKTAGFLAAHLGRFWIGSLNFHYRTLGPDVRPQTAEPGARYIYAIWHDQSLLAPFQFASPRVHILISQHADGEMIAEVCRHLRIPVIRGSASRGGVEAVRQILRTQHLRHMAITPDGPRGPRRHFKEGVIHLAARTGIPIVPAVFASHRPWRLHSWDRFAIPRPWSRAICISGSPILVPRNAGKNQMKEYRLRAQAAMDSLSSLAEKWAETGRWPSEVSHFGPSVSLGKTG
jgi:lysophospholipid acyltransferase (LPLAT)-like uncharacterized protein